MKKVNVLLLCLLTGIMGAKAQIGYQISLLNTATGEARANEKVVVTVTLSNNAGEAFYSETKSATTNDFGVLSLSIGNADTFKEVDLTKMPFFIEVTANGVMIGKSQILSVPVAEVAKRVAPIIDKNLIVGTWQHQVRNDRDVLSFSDNNNGTYQYVYVTDSPDYKQSDPVAFNYEIEGSTIYLYPVIGNDSRGLLDCVARFYNNSIYWNGKKLSKQ